MARTPKLPDGMWKRGKTYYARFRAGGREIRKKLSTDFRAACEVLNKLRYDADRGSFGILGNDYPWQDLKAEFLRWTKQAKRRSTFEQYARDLTAFEKYVSIANVRQIDEQLAIGWRAWLLAGNKVVDPDSERPAEPLTPRTVNRHIATLNNLLNKGVSWTRIVSNPLSNLHPLAHDELAKERRALTLEEVERLFSMSPEHLRPVWRMFMTTGIRKDELVSLTFDDVDFKRAVITIRSAVAKSHKPREIPLDDDMLATVKNLKEAAEVREPVAGRTVQLTERQAANFSRRHIFVTRVNTPWRNNLLREFYVICRRARIDGAERGGSVDIHSLRVSFATLSLDHGANPKAVQSILGHSTLALTMKLYTKSTEQSKRQAVAVLPFANCSQPKEVITVPFAHKVRTRNSKTTQTDETKAVG